MVVGVKDPDGRPTELGLLASSIVRMGRRRWLRWFRTADYFKPPL